MNRAVRSLVLLAAVAWSCSARAEDPAAKPYALTPNINPADVAVGKPCSFQLAIKPVAPWVLKTTTPLKITLATTSGLKVAKSTLTAGDLADGQDAAKAVTTGCEGIKAGANRVNADLSFFLCTDEICQRYTDKSELSIDVKP